MHYINDIQQFVPSCAQEATDQRVIVSFIEQHPHTVLSRDNNLAHITSSGFIMNKQLDRVLLAHHNIRGVWAWPGGHADGDGDLLNVAIKEAKEETGVLTARPLSSEIASLDILPVFGHIRRGQYVNAHLHLSVAYILLCDEAEQIHPRLSENTAVKWFPTSHFTVEHFSPGDTALYNKLIEKARALPRL